MMMMINKLNSLAMLVLLFVAAALLAPTSLQAQAIANSFGGFSQKNSKQPIDIEADSLEVLDDKKYAVFKGNVKARQGKFELVASQIRVTYTGGMGGGKKKKQGKNAIKWIEASGKVAISTADGQSATSDRARFDVIKRVVIISGNVVLSQSGNVMRGDKLIIDLRTGRSRFDTVARKRAGGGKQKRITGVFMPGRSKGMGMGFLGGKKKRRQAAPSGNGFGNPPVPAQRAGEVPPLPQLKGLQ